MNKRIKVKEYMESIFDIAYLIIVISFGIYYLMQVNKQTPLILFGSMTLILGIGDSFHLIPRILSNLSKKPSIYNAYLGIGKMITSISMTFFYVLLFYIYKGMYPTLNLARWIEVVIIGLAIIRIILCLMPQNNWVKNKDDSKWSLYRNIPFFLLGIIIIGMYTYTSILYQDGFIFMPIAITLSFLFYFPVALYANKNPKLGMLMIPKTIMYIWVVGMGMNLIC